MSHLPDMRTIANQILHILSTQNYWIIYKFSLLNKSTSKDLKYRAHVIWTFFMILPWCLTTPGHGVIIVHGKESCKCSSEHLQWKSYELWTTWGCINHDRIFTLGERLLNKKWIILPGHFFPFQMWQSFLYVHKNTKFSVSEGSTTLHLFSLGGKTELHLWRTSSILGRVTHQQ